MFDVEFALRAAAVVAAAALVAYPAVVAALRPVFSWRPTWSAPRADVTDDAQVVLEIARRFQAAGNAEGVRLCKSLIDVLLKPEKRS